MNDTQIIKDRTDIVQLIGEYVKVKKAGINWRANCPFHHEKTPSFMVHPEKQIWHCFGCGKGGDIFSFIQEIEGLEFIEALKLLAKRAGVQLDTHKMQVDTSQRNRLVEIVAKASAFYYHILTVLPAGENARKYLRNRQLTEQTITQCQIGYAPEQWDLLTKYLLNKGYSIDDIVASGLIIKRDGADTKSGRGLYDRFRGRIMFPLSDAHGTIVGFTGRVLIETENSGGKYVNTPQTLLYDKSRLLFGLHKAKTEIRNKDLAVLVEGQMDVIACHQAGMMHVVAVSGTALTPEQVKILKRYTNNIAIAFDADAAGQSAGKRGSEVALEAGMNVHVIQIPKGIAKDADECLKKNPDVWFRAVAEAPGLLEWYFRTVLIGIDQKNPAAKQQAADELLVQIKKIPFAVERDEWLKRLGNELSINIELLREELKKNKQAVLAAPSNQIVPVVPVAGRAEPFEVLLQEFWSLVIKFPENYEFFRDFLNPEYMSGTIFFTLYENAEKLYTKDQKLVVNNLRESVHQEGQENPVDLLFLRPYKNFFDLTSHQAKLELEQLLNRIKEQWRKRRGKELEREIAKAEAEHDTGQVAKLLHTLQSLSS